MSAIEPVQENDLFNFRCYFSAREGGFVSQGRRRGLDPAGVQMKQLYELMAQAVPDGGQMIEVVMTVRPAEE
ncbi:MAG TPA: hypothetical protein VMD08_17700 [Candidatus Baltobacteraceae bacterium]|nr:hypothetical protein [Candidatus Baltobacteraceae bacterium]